MKTALYRHLIVVVLFISSIASSAQINAERMILIGRNALFYDDYALSIQYFNQVIDAKPYLFEPYFYRGMAKLYLEDYNGAEHDCDKAIELNPYYPNSYEVRGLARINLKNYLDAAHDYEVVTRIEGNNKSLWHNLILCYLETDSLNQADSAVVRLINKWPNHADGYLLKAEVLLKKNDTITAEQYVDKALNVEKYSFQALSIKAELLMNKEEYSKAETSLNEAIRLQPKNSHNIINRALCRFRQNNYRGAMNDYDMALDIEPDNFTGHYNRGLLRASVGEDNKAIEDFDFILRLDPNDIMTLFNRARLYDQTGDYRSAIRDYTKVIEEFPKFLYGYQLRAEARRKIGDSAGAIKDEEHLLRENVAHHYGYSTPTSRQKNKTRKKSQVDLDNYQQLVEEDNAKVYDDEFRGKIQNKGVDTKLLPIIVLTEDANTESESVLNDYTIEAYRITPSALDDFRKGIEYCMSADETRLKTDKQESISNGQLKIGNSQLIKVKGQRAVSSHIPSAFKQATESFSTCLTKAPQFAEAYYNRAYTLAMQSKYDEALKDLDTAIQKKPNFEKAYFNRGVIYLLKNNPTAAFNDLSKAGELGIYQAYSIIKHNRK